MTSRRDSRSIPIAILLTAACSNAGLSGPSTATAGLSVAPARQVVVLGDSLAVSPSRDQGFPAHLQERIDREMPGWTIVNAGVNGDTTAGGLRRLPLLLTDGVGVLVVALGANDGLRGVDIETIEANLSRIIELAQSKGVRVLLCGLETIPTAGLQYVLDFHRLYPRLEARHDVPLVPFLLEGVALNPDMNGPDRVHPNTAGARRIAETVWPFLEALLGDAEDDGGRLIRASAARTTVRPY